MKRPGLATARPGLFSQLMPYRKVNFYPGGFYHVYNRGNRKKDIFFDKGDYVYFLKKVRQYKDEYEVKVIAYCLIPNHFHFVLQQKKGPPISEFMRHITRDYAIFINNKYELAGRLFQGPFKVRAVESEAYLLHLTRYIHLNPLDIGVQKELLATYPWSSYLEYIGVRHGSLPEFSSIIEGVENYEEYVLEGVEFRIKDGLRDLVIEE